MCISNILVRGSPPHLRIVSHSIVELAEATASAICAIMFLERCHSTSVKSELLLAPNEQQIAATMPYSELPALQVVIKQSLMVFLDAVC